MTEAEEQKMWQERWIGDCHGAFSKERPSPNGSYMPDEYWEWVAKRKQRALKNKEAGW